MTQNKNKKTNAYWITSMLLAVALIPMLSVPSFALNEEEEKAKAAKIVGPLQFDNNCSSCHALEAEAWKQTTHFATFKAVAEPLKPKKF